jgi:GNAT superfamily N-acetyltransferase
MSRWSLCGAPGNCKDLAMGRWVDAELAELDPDDLHRQVGSRLRGLPPDAYLRCLAYFMAEYRRLYHQHGLPDDYYRILDGIVTLAARAATGADVRDAAKRLHRELTELTYPGVDEDDLYVQMYDGPLDISMFKACGEVLWELTDEAHRYDSASNIVDVALDYEDPRDWLGSTRLLLRFLDRAEREAGPRPPAGAEGTAHRPIGAHVALDERRGADSALSGAVTSPLIVRRARPDDLHAVLDVLDTSAAWLLHAHGVPEWLTWPDRRDTLAAAIERGQVWLLSTALADVVGTVTLSTGDPGAGLWDDNDRQVAATYLDRLAVRPHLRGQRIGAELLDWARGHAYRHGSFWLRLAAWPRLPHLHTYLRRQRINELYLVGGPPATSRTLFAGHAGPSNPASRITEQPDPVLLPTQRVELTPRDARPTDGPGPDHAHRTGQLLSEHDTPVRIVPGYRYRLRHTDNGWRLQAAKYVSWQPGDPVTTAGGLVLDPDHDYVLTHADAGRCGFEITTVRRERGKHQGAGVPTDPTSPSRRSTP